MRNSYHWDLFDAAWASDGDMTPHINNFLENMTSEAMLKWKVTKLQMRRYLENGISNIRKDIARIRKKYKPYLQTKMFMYHKSDRIIVGTPDIYYHKTEDDIYVVMDCKWSMIWLYNKDETWISLQPPVYCKFVMEIHKVEEVKFAYYVVDKRTGSIRLESKLFTRELCDQMIDQCIVEYDYARQFDDYKPRESVQCQYCPLRSTCPLKKGKQIIDVESFEDYLF